MSPALPFTGERFTPECAGGIWYEHWHRYVLASAWVTGKDVLDAACGEGYGSAFLASHARNVIGIDVSAEATAHAASRYMRHNLRFQSASVTRLPLADASVDVVVSFETIEHLQDQEAMLAEFRRVLRPEGFLLLSAPNRPEYSTGQNYRNEFHVREHDRAELDALLAREFPCRRWQGQRLMFQSVNWPLNADSSAVHPLRMARDQTITQEPPAPMYFLVAAAATEASLPDFSRTTLFSDADLSVMKQYDSLMSWQWEARDRLHKLEVELSESQRLHSEALELKASERQVLQDEIRKLSDQLAVLEPASRQFATALETANANLVRAVKEHNETAAQLAYRNSLVGWLRWPLHRLRKLLGL
jgi:SAM-dependent methyltransferase